MPQNGSSVALLLASVVVAVLVSVVVDPVSVASVVTAVSAVAVFSVVEFALAATDAAVSVPIMAAKAVSSTSVSAMVFLSIFFHLLQKQAMPKRLLNDFSKFNPRIPQLSPKFLQNQ
jgi:hypothetical protein